MVRLDKKLFLPLSLFCSISSALAQVSSPASDVATSLSQSPAGPSSFLQSLSIGARVHYGSFIANVPKLQYVKNGYTVLGELDVSSQTTGTRSWQQSSNYPEIGMALLYGQTGASEYIGHMAALLPFMNFHLYETGGISANLRLALGPAWVEKPFNAETNYENLVIGSHLNACLNILLSTSVRILPRTDLDIGFSFTHVSNGSFTLPNLGLNIPSFSAGLKYELFPTQRRIHKVLPPMKKKINYYFFTAVAGKESLPLESAVYLVNVFNVEALKDFSRTGRFGFGINMTLDRANSIEVPYSAIFAFDKSMSHWEAAVYGVYEYVIGDLSFPLQVGYYLYNNYPVSSIYETAGVKYRFAPHWCAGFALKAHLGNGDFIQWGLGYKF